MNNCMWSFENKNGSIRSSGFLCTIEKLRACWSGLFYRHLTDEMGDFLNSTFRRQYATDMPQILQDCRVNIKAWSSRRISTENVQKMKIIVFY